MRKFLVASLIAGAGMFALPAVEASAATSVSAAAPQIVTQTTRRNRRWNNRGARVVTTTRITRVGRYRYRETIRRTYLPNGRIRTQVINRVRHVGSRNW
jgi:hypothetical protein